MPTKSSTGRGARGAPGAGATLRPASRSRPAPAADPVAEALALDRRLEAIDSLEGRLIEITRSVAGRVTFSTSLGIEDQAMLHAIAASGATIDIFTLDTGRHFPETLDTLRSQREPLRHQNPRHVSRRPRSRGARRERRHLRLPLRVEARKACCEVRKVRPLNRALEGARAGSPACAASSRKAARMCRSPPRTRRKSSSS